MTTFKGTFEHKDGLWTFEFFLPNMALIVNDFGAVMLSCQEVVVEINNENDKLSMWLMDRAKIKKSYEEEKDTYLVSIKRNGRWREAASFEKERI